MSIINITNFGGEMPSVSPRNLPAGAAQVNQNLLLSHSEFRPLSTDLAVATAPAGTKTLYRMARLAGGAFNSNPATGWVTATTERSYVKGQIDDELTERTYLTFDDGSAKPRAIDTSGADRVLGVPRPTKLTPNLMKVDELTTTEASAMVDDVLAGLVKDAIFGALVLDNVAARRNGSDIFAGPSLLNSGMFSDNAIVSGAGFANRESELWFQVPAARAVLVRGLNKPSYTVLPGGDYLTFLTCIPWTARVNSAGLTAALQAIVFPAGSGTATGSEVFTAEQVTALVELVQSYLSVGRVLPQIKAQMDVIAEDFHYTLMEAAIAGAGDADDNRAVEARLYQLQEQGYNASVSAEGLMRIAFKELTTTTVINAFLAQAGGYKALGVSPIDLLLDDRFYIATFVTDWGEESEPSAVSDMFRMDQNDTIVIGRPTLTTGETYEQRNIAKWRLYRTNAGSTSTEFQLVEEMLISDLSCNDITQASELGEACPTITWLQPPYRMDAQSATYPTPVSGSNPYLRGLVGMPNGIMAGFFDNTVAFCEPYVPYAWPVEYQISTEFPIVGLGVFGQTLFVGTTGNPYFISGADSASMSAQKLDSNQACVARKSIAAVQGGVLFASPDGLCVAESNGVSVVSAGIYTREDWQALNPASMFSADHENIYYLFYNNGTKGCLTFDLAAKKLGRLDLQADAVHVDRLTDTMYVALGSSIMAVFGGAARRTGKWKSGLITLPAHAGFAWLKVLGSQSPGFPATVRWYRDGALVYTTTVTSVSPVRLPPGISLEHEVEIESQARVTGVTLASSTAEMKSL